MYTEIHFVCDDPGFVPSKEALIRILSFISPEGPIEVFYYETPSTWDSFDPGHVDKSSYDSVQNCVKGVMARGAIRCVISTIKTDWGMRLATSLEKVVPRDLDEGFSPWVVSVEIGPHSIKEYFEDKTAAFTNFDIIAWGDGNPNDMEDYMKFVMETREVKEILDLFTSLTKHSLSAFPSID